MKCKNKEVNLIGTQYNDITGNLVYAKLRCICTNDQDGKTLSIDNGRIQFSIPFEKVEEYFKGDYR